MAHANAPTQAALAHVFLAHIPLTDRGSAIRDLAAHVDNNTLGLVAALTRENHDEQAEQYLSRFLVRSIEAGENSAASSICLRYAHIRKALLDHADKELQTALSFLQRRPKNSGLIIPPADHVSAEQVQAGEHISRSPEDNIQLTVAYLDFFKSMCRITSEDMGLAISENTFTALFALLAASTPSIASSARDACFAFLAAYADGHLNITGLSDDQNRFDGHMWHSVNSLLVHGPSNTYPTTAYAIWLRWLNLSGGLKASTNLMQTDEYWRHLLTALASGDIEQRKLCLHILRLSVAMAGNNISTKNMVISDSSNGSHNVQTEYERFCTVYETIVIGRYFNQAEECMKDLDVLASPHTQVEKSWLLALLEPALSNVTQDSIRKMLGNWLMSTDLKLSGHADNFAHLLQQSFLPWACQGPLFTGSIKGTTTMATCEHGVRLSSFIERLMKNNSADHEVDTRSSIARAVLSYLNHNKNRIIPYAVIYLLHGLAQGLQDQNLPCLGASELEILLSLPNGTAFPEVAKDVLQSCSLELAQLVEPDSLSSARAADSRLDMLSQRVQCLRLRSALDAPPSDSRWQSLDDYLSELTASHHESISGEALPGACRSLLELLDSIVPETENPDHMLQVLDSIWTELEIQDYPKNVLLVIPSLVLHPALVSLSISHPALSDLILSYLSQMHQFCRGRIYLWTPLMTALRVALFAAPLAARRLNLADIVIATANNPPSAKMEFQLEAAAIHLLGEGGKGYVHYYGRPEEEGFAAFFDLVNRLSEIDDDLAREIYDEIIDPWVNQKLPVPVVNKWKTTVQLQIVIILQEKLLATMTVSQAQYHMDILHKILAVEPLPRYRLLIEWMICRIIIKHAETSNDILQRLSTVDHHSNPKYLSSLAKIGLMIACLEDTAEEFAYRLACRIVALSSSSKIIIRHEAQWSFPILYDTASARGLTSITTNSACQALNEYIRSLERFSTPPTERQLEYLDPVLGHTLSNLLQGPYMRLDPPTASLVTSSDIQRLLEEDKTNKHLPRTLPSGSLPVGEEPVTSAPTNAILTPAAQPSPQETKQSARTEAVAALQTKGTAYLSAAHSKSSETDIPINNATTDLIVVGSLVDNAYNLGGLSRISEIFGASALYMNKPKSVLANKDFVSVAVASQNHLPIHELSPDNLQDFLTRKKTQGYRVVGVEQTDRSVLLGSEECVLPGKIVLVMGAEKEGVPALVLGECDVLVEIPQVGKTRSMNVQTACGVVLFEYSRQHRRGE